MSRVFTTLLCCVAVVAFAACTARPPVGKPEGSPPQAATGPDGLPPVSAGPSGIGEAFPLLPGGYRRILNGDIKGHAVQRMGNVSLAQCGSACSNATEFDCRSFDYYPRQRVCELSDQTAADVGGLRDDDYGPQLEHYESLLR